MRHVQRFCIETDSFKVLKGYLNLAINNALDSQKFIGILTRDSSCLENFESRIPSVIKFEKEEFLCLPVVLICGWHTQDTNFFSGEKLTVAIDENTLCADLIESLFKSKQEKWIEEFEEKCDDEYSDDFNKYDDSAKIGYRLEASNSYPEILAVSLCHYYYGK